MHDSRALDAVTRKGDGPTFPDSAYAGPACEEGLQSKEIKAYIIEKGVRNRPLAAVQQEANRTKSKCRSRVEQIMRFKILGANTPTSIQASYIKIPQKE